MSRRPLLSALADYARRHPEERPLVDRFEAFVEGYRACFERSLPIGHVTGSAWLVDRRGERVLLTHHRKLGRWLQLGGHADGDYDTLRVALREAHEESGLDGIAALDPRIFDLDIHPIPARPGEPAHEHYDVRYALRANGDQTPIVSDESHDLAWIRIDELRSFTNEPSMARMAAKWQRRPADSPVEETP